MTNQKSFEEQTLLSSIETALDESVDSLDGYTQSRLTTIRHQALAKQVDTNRRLLRHPLSVFGGAVALACSLVLVVSLNTGVSLDTELVPVSSLALEDLELLTTEEGMELFENLEFYQWLSENDASV